MHHVLHHWSDSAACSAATYSLNPCRSCQTMLSSKQALGCCLCLPSVTWRDAHAHCRLAGAPSLHRTTSSDGANGAPGADATGCRAVSWVMMSVASQALEQLVLWWNQSSCSVSEDITYDGSRVRNLFMNCSSSSVSALAPLAMRCTLISCSRKPQITLRTARMLRRHYVQ
jgi:hypothetical protein